MFVVDLTCTEGHVFEGWFDSRDDVDQQLDEGALECPMCGDVHVRRRPSFAAIARTRPAPMTRAHTETPATTSNAKDAATDAANIEGPPKMPIEVQRFLSHVLRVVRKHGEDVGESFADTALAIHRGEQEERLIYGQSTRDEEQKLVDEGVPFAKIPVPEIDEN